MLASTSLRSERISGLVGLLFLFRPRVTASGSVGRCRLRDCLSLSPLAAMVVVVCWVVVCFEKVEFLESDGVRVVAGIGIKFASVE